MLLASSFLKMFQKWEKFKYIFVVMYIYTYTCYRIYSSLECILEIQLTEKQSWNLTHFKAKQEFSGLSLITAAIM